YYRLSAYWLPFRKLYQTADGQSSLSENFKEGTHFHHATDLYAFSTVAPERPQSRFAERFAKLDQKETESKEEFAVHFRTKYAGQKMPIWMVVELLDFGPLSVFLSGMRYPDVSRVAASYGIEGRNGPHLLRRWIRCL